MAQPFNATYRITVPYTVTGVPHKLRFYVKSTGAVSGGNILIVNRTAGTDVWQDIIQAFYDEVLSWAYSFTETAMGTALLEKFDGLLWLPQQAYTGVLTTHGVAAPVYASQNTLVLRDTSFDQIKIVYLEASAPIPYHSASAPGSGIPQSLSAAFLSAVSVNSMYNYVVSRSNDYIAASGGFVGLTGTLNRKVRRRRGYA